MRSRCAPWFAVAAFAAALAVPTLTAEAAEAYAALANGQRIQGDIPVGQDIRLEFQLAAGTEPRLNLALTGGTIPISFTVTRLFGPDGEEIQLDTQAKFFSQSHVPGRDSIAFR